MAFLMAAPQQRIPYVALIGVKSNTVGLQAEPKLAGSPFTILSILDTSHRGSVVTSLESQTTAGGISRGCPTPTKSLYGPEVF